MTHPELLPTNTDDRIPEGARYRKVDFLYHQDIKPYDPLSRDEQVALIRMIQKGYASEKILRAENKSLSRAERAMHTQNVREGEAAWRPLVVGTLRLAVTTAKRYGHAESLAFNDLVQQSNLALVEGVRQLQGYDQRKGAFSTWIVWKMRHHLRNLYYQEVGEHMRHISIQELEEMERSVPQGGTSWHSQQPTEHRAVDLVYQQQQGERREAIRTIIRRVLTEYQSEVVLLSVGLGPDGQAHENTEIADMIGKDRTNVAHTLASARMKLNIPEVREQLLALIGS